MKLYATVTSERAIKGQGGKYLHITIQDSDKIERAFIEVTEENDEICMVLSVNHERRGVFWLKEAKGEKQIQARGAMCEHITCAKLATASGYCTYHTPKGEKQKGECVLGDKGNNKGLYCFTHQTHH